MTWEPAAIISAIRRWTQAEDTSPNQANELDARRLRRERRAAASTVAAMAARALLLVGTLISIPLSIGYLGLERFGVFVALTSLTAMFMFADLGLGNGLMTFVSDANGRDDREAARRSVSSAFFMLVGVAVVIGSLFVFAYPAIDWAGIFNVSTSPAVSEVGPTAAVLIGLFLIGLPLGIVERVRMAYQEGYLNSVIAMVGTVFGLVGLGIAILLQASLPLLVLAVSAPPVLAIAFNGLRLVRSDRPWLLPRAALATRRDALGLARIGFLFFVLQVAVAVAFQSDVLVAAAIIGPEAAATYAVTLRVFMFVPSLIGLFLLTLWPAYTEALARQDADWVERTLRRSLTMAAGSALVASLALLLVGAPAIRLLTGGEVNPPIALMIGAALWAVVNSFFNAIAMLMNAASIVLFQVITAVVMALGSVALSILFANWFGVSGIVWGTLVAYVVLSAIPIALYFPRMMRRLREGTLGLQTNG